MGGIVAYTGSGGANRSLSNLVDVAINTPHIFNPGSDIDCELIHVGVTGTPKLNWDETADSFSMTKGLSVSGLITATSLNSSILETAGTLKLQAGADGDVSCFSSADVGDADNGKRFIVWRNAPEGDDWIRSYVTAGRVCMYQPSNDFYLKGPGYVKIEALNNMYLDLGDNAGAQKIRFRDSDKAEVGSVDSDGNAWFAGQVDVPDLRNTAGDLKVQPDVEGDVVLFGDVDVDDAVNGKMLYVRRQAVEGDHYVRMYVSNNMAGILSASADLTAYAVDSVTLQSATKDIICRMGDDAGAKGTYFKNASNDVVGSVDSLGRAALAGRVTVGSITLGSERFRVQGSEATTNGNQAAVVIQNTAPGGDTWYLRVGATDTATPAGGFSIADTSAYRFVIDEDGNVGIGLTAPTAQFHIEKSYAGALTSKLYNQDTVDGIAHHLVGANTGGHINLVANASSSSYLGIQGGFPGIAVSYVNGMVFAVSGGATPIEQMRLTTTGLGIGITNPTAKFEVHDADPDRVAVFADSSDQTFNTGGGIGFGGWWDDAKTSMALAADISAKKVSDVSGEYDFDLVFETQSVSGGFEEAMRLTYDNNAEFAGDIDLAGSVDGRDVAADGAVLDAVLRPEIYLPAGAAILGNQATFNESAVELADAGTFARCYFTLHLPADFASFESGYPKVTFKQGTGGTGDFRIAFNTRAGGVGEQLGASIDNIAEYTMAAPGSTTIWEEDVSAAFDGLSLSAGDYIELRIQRDTDDILDDFEGSLDVLAVVGKYSS